MTRASSSNHHDLYSLDLKYNTRQTKPDINHFLLIALYFSNFSWVLGLFPIKMTSAAAISVLIMAFCCAAGVLR